MERVLDSKEWREFWIVKNGESFGRELEEERLEMNKMILSLINKFMVEHEDEIVEVITNPDGDLSKQWIEQGNSVKEYLGQENNNLKD